MNKAIIMIGIIFLLIAVPLMFYSPVTWVNVANLDRVLNVPDGYTDEKHPMYVSQFLEYNGEWWISMEDFKRVSDWLLADKFPIVEHHYLNLYPYRDIGISTVIFSVAIIIIGFVLPPRKLQKGL